MKTKMKIWNMWKLKNKPSHSCDFSRDAASLRSLASDTDGISNSRVHVKLPSDRRESKFDRSFPSVDELNGTASYHDILFSTFRRRDFFYFRQNFFAKNRLVFNFFSILNV